MTDEPTRFQTFADCAYYVSMGLFWVAAISSAVLIGALIGASPLLVFYRWMWG